MIERPMEETDEALLAESLANDEIHKDMNVAFFKQEGSLTQISEDEDGIVCYTRVIKSLRVDIHFSDNTAKARNAHALTQGSDELVNRAKKAGYSEIVFTTSNPELAQYCKNVFQ